MRRRGTLRAPAALTIALLILSFSAGAALAEDLKGKFYLGGGLGVLVTTDNVRNNAALIVAPLGDDGAPFTGDEGEEVACSSARADVFCDPRPDDLTARQTALETSFQGNLRFGYGISSLLSLEFSAGYYEGDITNMDVYTTKNVPISNNPLDDCVRNNPNATLKDACNLTGLRERDIKEPMTAGTVTQIPLEVNALIRFRKDSNLNPYLGGGIGYLIADLDVSEEIGELNDRFESLKLITTSDEFGPNFGTIFSQDSGGNAEFRHPAEVTVSDGFQWQFLGGVDYFFNDRFSLHFEAKYVLAREVPWSDDDGVHSVKISFNGEDQINLQGWTEDLFRADGSLRIFQKDPKAPNPIDPNSPNMTRFDCNVDSDPEPDFAEDYDGDGTIDQCFNPAPGTTGEPRQTVVAQGGKIELTNYTFGFGIKFHF